MRRSRDGDAARRRARLAARGGPSDPRAAGAGGFDLAHLVLPILVLALTQYARFTLFVRNTLKVLRDDHVQFARARAPR